MTHLVAKHYAPNTITTYVSAIGFLHKVRGHTDPSNNFIVEKVIQENWNPN